MISRSTYLEQLTRVKRWYERFSQVDRGRKHDMDAEFYQDEVYAFFLNCYHLKDWIEKDDSVGPEAKRKVSKFIGTNEDLGLCRDICNGIKHLKLKNGPTPELRGRKLTVVVGGVRETTMSVKYNIETAGGSVDAFSLATRCVQAWEDFISHNLT